MPTTPAGFGGLCPFLRYPRAQGIFTSPRTVTEPDNVLRTCLSRLAFAPLLELGGKTLHLQLPRARGRAV